MKARILGHLREEASVVSGELLSRRIGISRVSVWKHIRGLQECGYKIESTPRGYRLADSPDKPFGWEIPGWESRIHYVEEATSTMDLARDLARKGCSHLTVVVAGRQTQGRGRLQRTWFSQPGGLYFTVVLRPMVEPSLSGRLNFYAATVLAATLRTSLGVVADVKWPNDILVNEKKLAGLLSEMEADSDQVAYVNIGIGINVNNPPLSETPAAVSLAQILGRPVSRIRLLSNFLNRLETDFATATTDGVINAWKAYAVSLNRRVKVVTLRGEIEGLAVDVDASGALQVKQEDGTLKTVIYGDCFHQSPN